MGNLRVKAIAQTTWFTQVLLLYVVKFLMLRFQVDLMVSKIKVI